MTKTILSLCDLSGIWSDPYRQAGYNVIQVDLKLGMDAILYPSPPSESPRLSSQLVDIREHGPVHGILAAPVCTALSNAGAKHPRTDKDLREALALVDACIRLVFVFKPVWWVLENPIGKLNKWLGEPIMRFQPNHYGDTYTKLTQLWGDFNTNLPLNVVEPHEGSKMWAKYGGKSDRTKELRSLTPPGFAQAFFKANP